MIFDIYDQLKQFKSAQLCRTPNYVQIPVTFLKMNDEGIKIFNSIYQNLLDDTEMVQITRTPSGGISVAKHVFRPPMWDIRHNKGVIEITIIDIEGMWRIQIRAGEPQLDEDGNYFNWWKTFQGVCKKMGVSLKELAIDNGKEVKKEIPKYIIEEGNELYRGVTLEDVHHIDFHSSFGGGVAKYYPTLAPVYEYFYRMRKEKPHYKSCITNSIGKFHSEFVDFKWAHIARDAIKDNNERVRELARRLVLSGREILLYNTDGIWYRGDIYHGEGEGDKMGEWCNDHTNCTFRIKSKGAYEYIEDGKYHPVIRGYTNLDDIEPDREKWHWGDIFNVAVKEFYFAEGIGIIRRNSDDE